MRHVSRTGVLLSATLLIVATGCATKGWVREEMGKQEAQVGQRIGQVDERIGTEAKRVDTVDKRVDTVEGRVSQEAQKTDGMGVRVGTLETSITSTSEAARGARERADAAMAKAEGVDGRLTRLWNNRYNGKVVETVNVQFGFNRSELDDGAQTTLLGLVKEMQANPGLTVDLVGYTDTKGPRDYNYSLSQRRVESVRRFLVEKGVQIGRIQAVGLGALSDPGTPEAQKRRVAAKLMIDQD
jgi:outer membrane protein OmpA-like peptidoglycan-associated protein